MSSQPLQFSSVGDGEETGRAEIYGLLAQLFYAAPSAGLLAQLAVAPTQAPTPGAFLEHSWSALVATARRLEAAAVQDEYDALFAGLGKPEVFLYGSFYRTGFLNEKPLADLRNELARLGLTRADAMSETEDHVAYLCEVMRFLIAGDDLAVSHLESQRGFFAAHLRGWVPQLWDALEAHPKAVFYRALAAFARDFFDVEGQGFDMIDA